ncbi:hypothetical protein CR513_32337, partial [Mucuna pruriens]
MSCTFECSSSSSSSSSSSFGSEAIAAVLVVVAEGASSRSPAPIIPGKEHFEWVRLEVLSYYFEIPRDEVPRLAEERICYTAKEVESDFIYMYESVLSDLGVCLPFDSFTADILRTLVIAPSQLYPNGVGKKGGWVSLAPLPNTSLFNAYTMSYKGFKGRFVKIKAVDVLKKKSIDIDALIRRSQQIPKAKATFVPKGLIGAEKKSDSPQLEKEPVVEKVSTSSLAEKMLAPIMAEKMSAPVVTEKISAPVVAETMSAPVAKQKADVPAVGEALGKKGKGLVPSPLATNLSRGKVVVTQGPKLPPRGLSYYTALFGKKSLWGPEMNVQGMFPPHFIPQYDRGLLVIASADSTFDMLAAYHIHSLASLEVWRGLAKRSEQILAKKALNKNEFPKMSKACADLKAENERVKAKIAKLKADREDLWADLATSKLEATSMKAKTTVVEAEACRWKTRVVGAEDEVSLTQKSSNTMSKDIGVAKVRVAEMEAALVSDKEAKSKLGAVLQATKEDLKTTKGRITTLEAEVTKGKGEKEDLAETVELLEGAVVAQHKEGFDKALRQIAFLASDFD